MTARTGVVRPPGTGHRRHFFYWVQSGRSAFGPWCSGARRRRSDERPPRKYPRPPFERHREFLQADLREPGVARMAMQGIADSLSSRRRPRRARLRGPASGRPGFEFFPRWHRIFAEAVKARCREGCFCVLGLRLSQLSAVRCEKEVYLTEDLTKGPNDADNTYGWAKLMGEFTLQAYAREGKLKAASCRYFTVYGPRGVENHAVIAMIARAFIGQDPFEVWGDGTQIRNWTYIDDIVSGTILRRRKN